MTTATPLLIRTTLGNYYAEWSHDLPDSEYMATPAASLRDGAHDALVPTDFEHIPHIVEQRPTTITVRSEKE